MAYVWHAAAVIVSKRGVAGAAFAVAGHGLVVAFSMAVAIRYGGGPDADLDAGGRFAALLFGVLAFGAAQLILLPACVLLCARLGAGSGTGTAVGWVLGLAASLYYLSGGFMS